MAAEQLKQPELLRAMFSVSARLASCAYSTPSVCTGILNGFMLVQTVPSGVPDAAVFPAVAKQSKLVPQYLEEMSACMQSVVQANTPVDMTGPVGAEMPVCDVIVRELRPHHNPQGHLRQRRQYW